MAFKKIALGLMSLLPFTMASPVTLSKADAVPMRANGTTADFNMWMLAIGWPGSECNTERGCHYQDSATDPLPFVGFLIHGLWPNNQDGTYPSYCCKTPDCTFSVDKVKDIEKDLDTYWPSYFIGNEVFWQHEWDKHGTCQEMEMHEYFTKTIELRSKYDAAVALAKAQIDPVMDMSYALDEIQVALKEHVGGMGILLCNNDANGNVQLNEVRLCLDRHTLQPFDCPERSRTNQGCYKALNSNSKGRVHYPSYDPSKYIPTP
eukprot:TRINITY_DN14696_c0_g1::TRINITY_DN14696_c0_g1_i1::g.21488::m.21488 TRINITY_DN14696_c0_g1::TRINITY_DN14696_c0_g1_i1::g.21488  ORF type:complete len:289 (+),score=72.03,sp/P42813/RNS1_ARATH/39.58/1e-38,Ribonuclease_T2/PF00445.13/7.4e-44 TRINITY_DN14696_c0_g1_i1:83-868(+)